MSDKNEKSVTATPDLANDLEEAAEAPDNSSSNPLPEDVPVNGKDSEEKSMSMSEVNALVGMVRKKARGKAMSEIESVKQELAALKEGIPQGVDVSSIVEQVTAKLAENNKAAEEKKQLENHEKSITEAAKVYTDKLESGKGKYDDFDSVVSSVNVADMPPVWILASQVENTADIMYHLAKNKGKLANFLSIANQSPDTARQMMKELSDSLKKGDAPAARAAPDPVSRSKPSITAGSNNGRPTISDLRKQPWLKA